jgi:hypothetical protein
MYQVRAAMGAGYRSRNLGRNRPQLREFTLCYDAGENSCETSGIELHHDAFLHGKAGPNSSPHFR